jgi:hypothetical protein
MKSLALLALVVLSSAFATGCARPGEFGYTPAYSTKERGDQIARTWDYDGKQGMDDLDSILLLRPPSRMTIWSVR